MMLDSNAAADLNPRGLRQPFPGQGKALGRGHPVRTRARTGWNGRRHALAGMSAVEGLGMSTAEAISAIAAGAGPGTEAYQLYYGSGGVYSQAASVQAAVAESGGAVDPLPENPPAPMLYGAMPCGAQEMSSTNCVAYNQQVQTANLVLQANARRAWDLRRCEYNAAVNPGTATDVSCDQYRGQDLVPTVPGGVLQPAVCSGGECYTPFIGGTQAGQTTQAAQYAPPTPQQQASAIANRPNQTVPPREQPGEVVIGGGGEGGVTDGGDGKIFGLDPILLVAIAGVALLALRK
jgi:hypothetical protein